MIEYLFIAPLDVLYLRGNRLFGAPGDHGESLMPPWPSLLAGAIRSRMLADCGIDLNAFAKGKKIPDGTMGQCLGSPERPGTFRIQFCTLARKTGNLADSFLPLPADVIAHENQAAMPVYLRPTPLHESLDSGFPLPAPPILQQEKAGKPEQGLWLNGKGINRYLAGKKLNINCLVAKEKLWKTDHRLGIALDPGTRTAESGRIYTTETVALCENTGFLVGVAEAAGCLPQEGLVRLGGDGRGAVVTSCRLEDIQMPWPQIADEKRFRVVLSTPGLVPDGRLLPSLVEETAGWVWRGQSFSARLVSASVSRAETVSGWDVAAHCPKTAQKAAPIGSVYWFDSFEGDVDSLKQLVEQGLWLLINDPDDVRRAEGFNNILVAAWPKD